MHGTTKKKSVSAAGGVRWSWVTGEGFETQFSHNFGAKLIEGKREKSPYRTAFDQGGQILLVPPKQLSSNDEGVGQSLTPDTDNTTEGKTNIQDTRETA